MFKPLNMPELQIKIKPEACSPAIVFQYKNYLSLRISLIFMYFRKV